MSRQLSEPPAAPSESTRRRLSGRQADQVVRLAEAAAVELRAEGYEGLTVRNVAKRAGVAAATAYTYFGSKDHLVAELFWRRLAALPPVRVDRRRAPAARVGAALAPIGDLITSEPELAAACTGALLAPDPDVHLLRERIGRLFHERLAASLDEGTDPTVLRSLDLAFSGALLQAGMGSFPYAEVTPRMTEVADALLHPDRRREHE